MIKLSEMTVNSEKVLSHLRFYLDKISAYQGFDQNMKLVIYVTPEKDFMLFEAVTYRIGFLSTEHKMNLYRPENTIETNFRSLYAHVKKLGGQKHD